MHLEAVGLLVRQVDHHLECVGRFRLALEVDETFKRPSPASGETENLTPREQEVIDFLAKGYLYKEIAEQLSISYGTVHTYVERIFKKLHVRSRAQAVAKYLSA